MEHARAALEPEDGEIRRAIADAADDRLLGIGGLMRFAPHGRSCEGGYWLAPGGRGGGAAPPAGDLICEGGFGTPGPRRVELPAPTQDAPPRAGPPPPPLPPLR